MRRASVMSEPRPRILMRSCVYLGTATVHRRAHRLDRRGKPREHRLSHQEMPDVEFDDLRRSGDCLGAGEIEAMAGVHFQAKAAGELGAVADATPFHSGGIVAIKQCMAPRP